MIVLVGAFVLLDRMWPTPPEPRPPTPVDDELVDAPDDPALEPSTPANSIAVLAFTDMSPNKDQEYFADGLSDTLIHVLAQDWKLESLRQYPEFIALLNELEADILKHEGNKDKPLL